MTSLPSPWLAGFAAAADALLDRLDPHPPATVLLQGFCLTPLARRLVAVGPAGLGGWLAPMPPAEEASVREALGGQTGWTTLKEGVDLTSHPIPIEARSLDLAILAWHFGAAPSTPVLALWQVLLRPGGRFAALLWADGSPRVPLKCLTEAIRIETGQSVKQTPVGFPASASALRQTALDAGFSEARSWEEKMALPFADPVAVFDQVWPSLGPAAARFDNRRVAAIRARFSTLLDAAVDGARPLPIACDYCGLIAER